MCVSIFDIYVNKPLDSWWYLCNKYRESGGLIYWQTRKYWWPFLLSVLGSKESQHPACIILKYFAGKTISTPKKKLTGGPALKQCISQMQKIDNHGMWIRVYLNYSPLSLSLSLFAFMSGVQIKIRKEMCDSFSNLWLPICSVSLFVFTQFFVCLFKNYSL